MTLKEIAWLWFIILILTRCAPSPAPPVTNLPPTPTSLPASSASSPPVQMDTTGALAWLQFCRALNQGRPWEEAAIREMVTSPPYQTLIAHHSRMDAGVTAEAFVQMLLALRDGEPFATNSERLARIYAAYRSACDQISTLQVRLKSLVTPALVERAAARARAALPPQTRLQATVYLLPDGRSAGYVVESAVVLDLLQISGAGEIEGTLAHELHHIGAYSLLPEPCPEPGLGTALETLVELAQEGAATYWVDDWRASPIQADFACVEAFLQDALSEQSGSDEQMARLAELVQGWRGPLYQVGNDMIATLVAARGGDWVQAHLGDPVGLLRAWRRETESGFTFDQELFLLLERAETQGKCPAWFPQER